jgi:hypothetical protein
MKATSPVLTRRTSLWNGWLGFNGSHGLGILLFVVIYLLLAVGRVRAFLLRNGTPRSEIDDS